MLYPKYSLMSEDWWAQMGSFLGHRLQLCMLPSRLWVTEVSKPVMIWTKSSVCSVAKKDEKKDFKEMKWEKEQGRRISQKHKIKITMQQKEYKMWS